MQAQLDAEAAYQAGQGLMPYLGNLRNPLLVITATNDMVNPPSDQACPCCSSLVCCCSMPAAAKNAGMPEMLHAGCWGWRCPHHKGLFGYVTSCPATAEQNTCIRAGGDHAGRAGRCAGDL